MTFILNDRKETKQNKTKQKLLLPYTRFRSFIQKNHYCLLPLTETNSGYTFLQMFVCSYIRFYATSITIIDIQHFFRMTQISSGTSDVEYNNVNLVVVAPKTTVHVFLVVKKCIAH